MLNQHSLRKTTTPTTTDRMDRMEVWTASHCSSPERFQFLLKAIASVQRLGYFHRISVSGCSSQEIEQIREQLGSPGHCYPCPERKSQFGHLQSLLANTCKQPDIRIMFLDDDDLLLSHPPKDLRVKGSQILVDSQEDLTPELFEQLDWSVVDPSRLVVDFSGYTCLRSDLESFDPGTIQFESFADLAIMNHLDSLGAVDAPVFIMHRLHEPVTRKTWMRQLWAEVDRRARSRNEEVKATNEN